MTDDEVIRRMTDALRALDTTQSVMEDDGRLNAILHPMNRGCPICSFVRDILNDDIETIDGMREALVEKTRHPDTDEKLVFATKVKIFAKETTKRYAQLGDFLDVAHAAISEFLNARIQEIEIDDHPGLKKFLKSMMEDGAIPMPPIHGIDPKKAN